MKNSEYWKGRFELLEAASNRDGASVYHDIEGQYMVAGRQLEGQIQSWYQRFATNNKVTMVEAKKMLNAKELAELKWDVGEYIKYGEQLDLNPAWMQQLENASARYHISRIEALKLQTQQSVEVLFGNQTDEVDSLMKKIYSDGYYHTAYEIQKGFNVGWDIAGVDQSKLEKIISKPWAADGKNFSDRIWTNKTKLTNELHTELTQMCMLGKAPDTAIKNIAKKMNTSKNNAGRLVMTESAYFSSASQKDAFNDLDVERFEIVATLDSHTSAICQEMDGKVFPMKDYEPGVTAPPFHVWCRSCTVPYFEDNYGGERAARGEDGKTYYVPDSMKYPDWKKTFTEGGSKDGLKPVEKSGIIVDTKTKAIKKVLGLSDFPSEFTVKAEGKNTQKLVDFINKIDGADPNVVNLYGSMGKLESITSNHIPFSISHGKGCAVGYSYRYNDELVQVKLTIPKLDGDDLMGQVNTTLHEEMHLMDLYCRRDAASYKNWFSTEQKSLVDTFQKSGSEMSPDIDDLFKSYNVKYKEVHEEAYKSYQMKMAALRDDFNLKGGYKSPSSVGKQYVKDQKALRNAMDEEVDYLSRNAMGGGISNLQDIYDALSRGAYRDSGIVKFGHGSKYYRSVESRIHETVANYGALSVTRPDLIDMLRASKPDLVEELDKFIQAMLERVGE